MRNLFLTMLLLVLFISSCKKTTSYQEPEISGKWTSSSAHYIYYDKSDKVLFTQTNHWESNWVFSGDNVTLTIPSSGEVVTSKFNFNNTNGVQYISFTNPDIAFINTFQIKEKSTTTMYWTAISTDPKSTKYGNEDDQAAKVVYSFTLISK